MLPKKATDFWLRQQALAKFAALRVERAPVPFVCRRREGRLRRAGRRFVNWLRRRVLRQRVLAVRLRHDTAEFNPEKLRQTGMSTSLAISTIELYDPEDTTHGPPD